MLFATLGLLKSRYLYFNLSSVLTFTLSSTWKGGVSDSDKILMSSTSTSTLPVFISGLIFSGVLAATVPVTAITYSFLISFTFLAVSSEHSSKFTTT